MQEISKSRKAEKVGLQKIRKVENQKKSEIGEKKIKQGKYIDQLGHG